MSETIASSLPLERDPVRQFPPDEVAGSNHDRLHLAEVPDNLTSTEGAKASGGPKSRRVELIGLAMTLAGVLLAMFILYLYVFSGLSAARSQNRLLHTLSSDPRAVFSLAEGNAPKNGAPVAVLNIPVLGVHQAVVNGTSSADLQMGPGLAEASGGKFIVPGEPGNTVIAGRRVSFGGAFRGISSLQPGDTIQVIDGAGDFSYSVTNVETISQGTISTPRYGRSWLVLVTSNSAWLPTGRSVVVARLDGQPVGSGKASRAVTIPSFVGDNAAGILAALWAIAFIFILGFMMFSIRKWRQPWVSWLLASPLLLACGLFACETLARCLPSTL
ncbi:MAG: sortase [Acidimicrobiales bacterium]|jgi:sortase A